MSNRIYRDEQEFRNILRGILRRDLVKFIQHGEILLPAGPGEGIKIVVKEIEIPRLRFESPLEAMERPQKQDGDGELDPVDFDGDISVGQGSGNPGDILGPVNSRDGDGGGERTAGRGRGNSKIKIEISQEEFYQIFKEVFQLPRIKPKGEKEVKVSSSKYTGISKVGPESLRHNKRTFRQAIKRSISEGLLDFNDPKIIPLPEDKRFRSSKPVTKPRNNAIIFYMMDVSGSVTEQDREVIRDFCRISEFWIRCNYDEVEMVWIVHDDGADRVSREDFFKTERNGGTVISSAFQLMLKIVEAEFPPAQWNIYPMYFSDGFNWNEDDILCKELLINNILSIVNQFTYGEVAADRPWLDVYVHSTKGPKKKFSPQGNFGNMLSAYFSDNELVAAVNLTSRDAVPEAIREAFKRGN